MNTEIATPLVTGDNEIIGVLIRHVLRNDYGSTFGRQYVVYAKPGYRTSALMQGVEASLRMQGIEDDSDDIWNQTWVYWGVIPEIPSGE